jgi:AcrR family transcriptional regulator
MSIKLQRQQTLQQARRALVLDAARVLFDDAGLAGFNMRDVARRAGYTPGALYAYFDCKEALLSGLLSATLDRLEQAILNARQYKTRPDKTLQAQALAWFNHLLNHPYELDLLLATLLGSGAPLGAQANLYARWQSILRPCEAALVALGAKPLAASQESAALQAQALGLLLAHRNLAVVGQGANAEGMFRLYLDQVLARFVANSAQLDQAAELSDPAWQVDLFA